MFEPHTKFGKLSTEGGNTCRQRKAGRFVVKTCDKEATWKLLGHHPNMQLLQYLVECMFNERILDRLRCLQTEDRIKGDKILK